MEEVACSFEQRDNLCALAEVSTPVHADVFAIAGRGVDREPADKKLDGRCFGLKALHRQCAREVVSNEDVAGLPMETDIVVESFFILGFLNNEAKIDGETLPGFSCRHGCAMTFGRLLGFAKEASGAAVNAAWGLEFGDTVGVLVHFRDYAKVEVAESVMVEHGHGARLESSHGEQARIDAKGITVGRIGVTVANTANSDNGCSTHDGWG